MFPFGGDRTTDCRQRFIAASAAVGATVQLPLNHKTQDLAFISGAISTLIWVISIVPLCYHLVSPKLSGAARQ